MPTRWRGDQALDAIRTAAANGLWRAALLFENQQRQRVSVVNPPPYHNSSKPGEYPRLRTGDGLKGLTHRPVSKAEVKRDLKVVVGYVKGADHLLILELFRDRLGLQKTLADMLPQLSALAVAEFRS